MRNIISVRQEQPIGQKKHLEKSGGLDRKEGLKVWWNRSSWSCKMTQTGVHVVGDTYQVQQLVLDHDKEQIKLVNEALDLLFEKYGKPPIA